jgi:Ca2+-transporting ATPase
MVRFSKLIAEKPVIDILPFSFERKRMSTIHTLNGDVLIYTKGASRNILDLCTKIFVDGEVKDLTQESMELIETKIHEFANEGLRVIAVAYNQISKTEYKKDENTEKDLIFVGLAAMRDPPRIEEMSKSKTSWNKNRDATGDRSTRRLLLKKHS